MAGEEALIVDFWLLGDLLHAWPKAQGSQQLCYAVLSALAVFWHLLIELQWKMSCAMPVIVKLAEVRHSNNNKNEK